MGLERYVSMYIIYVVYQSNRFRLCPRSVPSHLRSPSAELSTVNTFTADDKTNKTKKAFPCIFYSLTVAYSTKSYALQSHMHVHMHIHIWEYPESKRKSYMGRKGERGVRKRERKRERERDARKRSIFSGILFWYVTQIPDIYRQTLCHVTP